MFLVAWTELPGSAVATLQGQVEDQASELTANNEQIRELHFLLQQAQATLPAPKEDRRSWWRFW